MPLMLLAILVFLVENLFATNCQENIINYYNKSGTFFHTRKARAEHLIDLISNSSNKFDLINNIYLHYRSIDDSTSQLSQILEQYLLDLLNIPQQQNNEKFLNIFKRAKFSDPVHNLIASEIVNINFYKYNLNNLERLIMLDKLETGFLTSSQVTKAHFDEVLKPQSWTHGPDYISKLRSACEEVLALDNYGHSILVNFNAAFVHTVIKIVGNLVSTEELRQALAAYLQKPEARSFDQIRIRVRKVYQIISGECLGPSPSEYWAQVLDLIEHRKQELIADALEQAQNFRLRSDVMQALRIENNFLQAKQDLEQKISCSDLHEFTRAYEKLISFSPSGFGLFWSEDDTRNFVGLARNFRAFIKSTEPQVIIFDHGAHNMPILKSTAQIIFTKINKLYSIYINYEEFYNNQKNLLRELKAFESHAEHISENITYNLSRALSRSTFSNLEEVKTSAFIMMQALGDPRGKIQDRLNSLFADTDRRDCI